MYHNHIDLSHQRVRHPNVLGTLWLSSGVQSVGLFIIADLIYGYQPQVGTSADALVAFYDGERGFRSL